MNIGILAQNRNRNSDGSKGLTIQCNEFNAILNDIAITAATSGSDKGIKENQGNGESAVTLANNIFSLSGLSQTYNFYDVIGNLIRYFHANVPDNVYGYRIQPNINPEGNLLNEEKNFTFNKETCCPSEIF